MENMFMELDSYICKICGRPNPEIAKRQGVSSVFEDYLFWNKERVIKHIKEYHPEIAKNCE
mgnify:FL=1